MASKPSLNNSLLTFGPTFSTRLKFIFDPKSEDNFSFIDFIKFLYILYNSYQYLDHITIFYNIYYTFMKYLQANF